MKKTIIKFIQKVDRWFRTHQPEDIVNLFMVSESQYFKDQRLIGNRYATWDEYASRGKRI